jgi:hypothetical protein
MTYRFGYMAFVVFSVGDNDLARAAAKASSWNGFGCGRACVAIASACARMDYLRDGLPCERRV